MDISAADKLTTARTIKLGGYAQGQVDFDGSKNVVVTLSVPKVESAVNAENAESADKLTTARKIKFTGAVEGEVTVDWSGDITINLTASEDSLITDEISDDELDLMF